MWGISVIDGMCREWRGKGKTIEVNGGTIGVVGLRGLILVWG